MRPNAMRSQFPRSPHVHASHRGEIPRATHPRTGSTTTRFGRRCRPRLRALVRTETRRSGRSTASSDRRSLRDRCRRCRQDGVGCAPNPVRGGRAGRCRRAAEGRRARRHRGAPRSRHVLPRTEPAFARTAGPSQPGLHSRAFTAGPSQQGLHDRTSRSGRGRRSFATVAWGGPMGRSERGPPDDFAHCSTSQPRLRAIVASLTSGFTATG